MEIIILGLPSATDEASVFRHLARLGQVITSTNDLFVGAVRHGSVTAIVDRTTEVPEELCVIRVMLPQATGRGLCRGFAVWLMCELTWLGQFLPMHYAVRVSVQCGTDDLAVECYGTVFRDRVRIGGRPKVAIA